MPGRSYTAGTGYRYGFNGKEKDSEVKGEGNSYDYGARMYDPRVARWLSIDTKTWKFPNETPYGFVSNSPLVFVDPDGEEKIVVIGGGDPTANDPNKFINAGLLQLKNYALKVNQAGSNEPVTALINIKFISGEQYQSFLQAMGAIEDETGVKISVNALFDGGDLTNYINSKNTQHGVLSDGRKNDKITDLSLMGHGYHPEFSSQGDVGAMEPAHSEPGEAMDADPSTRPEHNKWSWGMDELNKVNPEAFAENSSLDYYTCNPGTPNTNGQSLVSMTSEKLPNTTVSGYYGRSDYGVIYQGASFANKMSRKFNHGVGPATQLAGPGRKTSFPAGSTRPNGGYYNNRDKGGTSERVRYKAGKKIP